MFVRHIKRNYKQMQNSSILKIKEKQDLCQNIKHLLTKIYQKMTKKLLMIHIKEKPN